jgi:RNA polymerase sigma-70 factor (ECF subfamily)
MSTIVFRTTMDAVRDTLRQQQQMPLVEGETAPEPPTASTALATLHAEDIFRYIQQLPDDWRVVFSLYVIEGYKHEEIATLLNIPIGTSKWRLAKAKAALKTALGPIYQNEPSA